MSLYKQFGTNTNHEKDGIVVEYGTNSKGETIRFRIARAGGSNQKYTKVLERKTKPYRRQIQNETLEEDTAMQIQREAFAEAVILGWEGVEDRDNNPIPFTRENVIQLLTDLPDLFADIRDVASKASMYRAEVLETESKN